MGLVPAASADTGWVRSGTPLRFSSSGDHLWKVRRAQWQNSTLDGTREPVTRSALQILYDRQTHWGHYHLNYEHQPLRVRQGAPAHNGYLHQVGGRWQLESERWSLALAGGLHASSNLFRHGRFHREALVTRFGATHTTSWNGRIGLAGDYRFGGFRVYPRLIHEMQGPKGTLTLDLPRGVYFDSPEAHWQLRLERYGNKWGALDGDREVKSAVYLQEWRFTNRYRQPMGGTVFLDLELGISFDTRIRYLDLEAGEQNRRLDSAQFIAVSLGMDW